MKKLLLTIGLLLLSVGTLYPQYVSSSPYGINVHLATNDVLQKVKDAGIRWIRIDVDWSAVELSKGYYHWTQLDRVIDYAATNGLSVLAAIAYTPEWANGNKGFRYPADNVSDWENFVYTVVERYKIRVAYWSIWNEPNSETFFALGKDDFVERVFLPAAQVIRNTDPTAFIVGPELAHLNGLYAEWYFWLKYILTQAGDYIDVISHHIYKNEGVYLIYEILEVGETLIPSVQEVIEETGNQDKPFWLTETGWTTSTFSEQVQSDYYLEMLQERKTKVYPHKIFFYEIIDDPSPGIDPWGILRSDLTEKQSYTIYKNFIAGKYNDDDSNTGGDDGKKKCFASQNEGGTGSGGNVQVLSTLRSFRDELALLHPSASLLINRYYDLSDEMLKHARSDSRIQRLSTKLLNNSNRFLVTYPRTYLYRSLDSELYSSAAQLFALLKEKESTATFQSTILWSESQLELLKTIPLSQYLNQHLSREVQKLATKHTITDYSQKIQDTRNTN